MEKRFYLATFLAWLTFVGVDFLFHGSLLASFWLKEHPSLKPLEHLALLIPAGYLSFLLLTLLVGWLYHHRYSTFPGWGHVIRFGVIFAFLFSAANFLGQFSYLMLPIGYLLGINLVYFLELVTITLVYGYMLSEGSLRKKVVRILLLFFGLLVTGIIIQNIFGHYQ